MVLLDHWTASQVLCLQRWHANVLLLRLWLRFMPLCFSLRLRIADPLIGRFQHSVEHHFFGAPFTVPSTCDFQLEFVQALRRRSLIRVRPPRRSGVWSHPLLSEPNRSITARKMATRAKVAVVVAAAMVSNAAGPAWAVVANHLEPT